METGSIEYCTGCTLMKALTLKPEENRIAEALREQPPNEAVVLMQGEDAVGLMLNLPEEMKNQKFEVVLIRKQPGDDTSLVIELKHSHEHKTSSELPVPVFGSCRGMLTIISDDDEHLKDFAEYME